MSAEAEKEFENTIARYGGIITKICYYFSTDPEEFNDLRQEVLYNIWRGWENFRKDSGLSSWIYRISLNTCISFQRKTRTKGNTISIEQVIDIPYEEETSYVEKYNSMHALIRQLKYEERAMILMWLDEKTYEEISELMGINRNTVAVRLKRIKEKLIKLSKDNLG
ncbi:MAG: sigma-70 family RNA polymerase sigma factor [Muribaculaceae bacterium]|nr:sigma-70 family RNA polymerase sigma factor [Muribaculaceae bacterium]